MQKPEWRQPARRHKSNSRRTAQPSMLTARMCAGMLSAKGLDASGKVNAETRVETTGAPTQIQLTPDRATINADGEDVSVFTAAVLDALGRAVPVAQNRINFS